MTASLFLYEGFSQCNGWGISCESHRYVHAIVAPATIVGRPLV